MAPANLLLGNGESLTEDVVVTSGGGEKVPSYSFFEARDRILPMLRNAADAILNLPDDACPDDRAVLHLTLNPAYLAKSYYPKLLLNFVDADVVGSCSTAVCPVKMPKKTPSHKIMTTVLFAFGYRSKFQNWSRELKYWTSPKHTSQKQIAYIEGVSAPSPLSKVVGTLPDSDEILTEIVLHPKQSNRDSNLFSHFQDYVNERGLARCVGRSFSVRGLCFVEVNALRDSIEDIATYAGVRALRVMPKLRSLYPVTSKPLREVAALEVPRESALSNSVRVAILDGGIPRKHPLSRWTEPQAVAGIHGADEKLLNHGTAVTSAALFGPIQLGEPLPVPFAKIDHYPIVDKYDGLDETDLYLALERVDSILSESGGKYDLINISFGPNKPVEDGEVDAWTTVIDSHLSNNNCLAAIAVGNNGELDAETRLNRVLVPSDCVNALAVGACNSLGVLWDRAPYSAVGPGRRPGIVKPDLISFGGSESEPFWAFGSSTPLRLYPKLGTSYSAPHVIHIASGIKACLGPQIDSQAIRALLIHTAEKRENDSTLEVGFGRCAQELDTILYCSDHEVRIVYQGSISPKKYIRAHIPIPASTIQGMVTLKATICYRSLIDPHHLGNHTQSTLETTFRPHSDKYPKYKNMKTGKVQLGSQPTPAPFFNVELPGAMEYELRKDSSKWENCFHETKSMRGTSLKEPVFDLHYLPRKESQNSLPDQKLNFALVVSVTARSIPDLYDQVVRNYAGYLSPMQPILDVPLRS